MERKLSITFGLAMTFAMNSALAAGPVNEAQWPGQGIRQGFHDSITNAGCAFASLGASNSWNAVNASFAIAADLFYTYPRVQDQTQAFNYQYITVEDAPNLPSPTALMKTRILRDPGGGTIINADIFVISSRLDPAYADDGGFYCLTSSNVPGDQFDFESSMLHEFGHALGFQVTAEYYGDVNCAMYYGLAAGQARRTLCNTEKQEFLDAYGAL
ncbi:hypothetical protein [Pseudoxanthomonas sp. JBR18]|uniref:hypothetical protein n=1 Tax=Pseudoxanthomonas sp. JBR18 TaxID=2969308 RepID=UPI002305A0F9|nr:hypothetical protein [Pseudoxanthomonas sp. JBR18]WCE05855.1 hypothetical protein PJ250_07875 [Pseudoxanthomonas sp. JBR18]